jgi:hypothetical protein
MPRLRPLATALLALLALAAGLQQLPAARAFPSGGLAAPRHRYPWDIPREEAPRLPWEGLQNDLPALLQVQARGKEVAVIVFNEGFSALALNCLVSLIEYGRSPNYIVTSVGASSLAYCQALRLPCYDGANLLANITTYEQQQQQEAAAVAAASGGSGGNASALSTDVDAKRYTTDWFHLVWIKTLVAHAVNGLGYDVLFAGGVRGRCSSSSSCCCLSARTLKMLQVGRLMGRGHQHVAGAATLRLAFASARSLARRILLKEIKANGF